MRTGSRGTIVFTGILIECLDGMEQSGMDPLENPCSHAPKNTDIPMHVVSDLLSRSRSYTDPRALCLGGQRFQFNERFVTLLFQVNSLTVRRQNTSKADDKMEQIVYHDRG